MDATTLDDLSKQLATKPLTRSKVVRGLIASAAALAGVRLTGEPGTTGKKKEKERKVCVCSGTTAADCRTKKTQKSKIKKILKRNPCAYRGPCSVENPCTQCTTNGQCTGGQVCVSGACLPCSATNQCGGLVCVGNRCVRCTSYTQCNGDKICLDGWCRGNEACTAETDCYGALKCLVPVGAAAPDTFCLLDDTCTSSGECPGIGMTLCRLGGCIVTCTPQGTCLAGEVCRAGLCIPD